MPGTGLTVLFLEDNADDVALTLRKLRTSGLEINPHIVGNSEAFKEQARQRVFDIILGDFRLPSWTGLDALRWLRSSGIETPFILVTGTLGDELAVECMRQGASDYVLKDKLDRLPFAVRRAIEENRLRIERDRALKELLESEQQYRSIINGAPYGICQSEESGRVILANPALVAMLGYESEEQFISHNMIEVYADPQERQAALAHLGENPAFAPFEVTWKRQDGKKINVRLAGRRLPGKADSGSRYEVFVENLTEQRALQRQFQQAQKMEAVGRLAGGVAHDFNNLLMIMRGSCELLEMNRESPEKVAAYLKQIQSATTMATTVVQQLLAFSRQEAPGPQLLDLNAVIAEVAKMLPRLLGVDIKMTVHPSPKPALAQMERGHIEQIVMNLAVNARDAMPGGGKLEIRVSTGNDGTGEFSRYVSLELQDTGEGMTPEVLSRIFEPFFTTKERGKGTGLGLSTVYGIVQQNHGRITVDSTPGQGTTFTVLLPAAESAPEPKGRTEDHAVVTSSGNETVLLVEDEEALRELTAEFLRSRGYVVLIASQAAQALEICRAESRKIDVLVTDVIMPGISGPQLAADAIKLRPQMRVIFVSGYADTSLRAGNMPDDAMFLQKPFSLSELAQKIREACLRKK